MAFSCRCSLWRFLVVSRFARILFRVQRKPFGAAGAAVGFLLAAGTAFLSHDYPVAGGHDWKSRYLQLVFIGVLSLRLDFPGWMGYRTSAVLRFSAAVPFRHLSKIPRVFSIWTKPEQYADTVEQATKNAFWKCSLKELVIKTCKWKRSRKKF